jgi:hypothetical protein
MAKVPAPWDTAAAKASLPPVDSINLWPMLSGLTDEPARTEIYGDGLNQNYGFYINGSMKLVLGSVPFAVWTGPVNPNSSAVNWMKWNCSSCSPPGATTSTATTTALRAPPEVSTACIHTITTITTSRTGTTGTTVTATTTATAAATAAATATNDATISNTNTATALHAPQCFSVRFNAAL